MASNSTIRHDGCTDMAASNDVATLMALMDKMPGGTDCRLLKWLFRHSFFLRVLTAVRMLSSLHCERSAGCWSSICGVAYPVMLLTVSE